MTDGLNPEGPSPGGQSPEGTRNSLRSPYRRVLLKVSGEVLAGQQRYGIESAAVERIAGDIQEVAVSGVQVCLVVGGGNIFRGVSPAASQFDRVTADHIGMLATVMNCLALQGVLDRLGVNTRILSAIPMIQLCEPYIRRRALRHLEKGRVVLFAAGTGVPFFSTDTAAALRALEMSCDALLKGTKVDGIYSADPHTTASAKRYRSLSHYEVLTRDLKVMDAAALALARENNIPILVFSIQTKGAFAEVLSGSGRFTSITNGGGPSFGGGPSSEMSPQTSPQPGHDLPGLPQGELPRATR